MKTIFADPTPRWVPFAASAMIVVGVWVVGVWQDFNVAETTRIAVGLACILFVLIFFQGRYYWKGQVDHITATDGEYFEAVTSIWVGRSKRVAFGAHETRDWTATPSSSRKPGEPQKLSTISFTAKGQKLEMSFLNPTIVDLAGLSALNPDYFAKVQADYPTLVSVAG